MKYFLLLAGLLLALGAEAQTKPPYPVWRLRPRTVRLDSGTIAMRPLVGLDPATYEQLQADKAADSLLLRIRGERLLNRAAQRRNDSLALYAYSGEIRRLRDERAHAYALVSRADLQLDKALSRPLQKPLLFSPQTYKGALGGVLLTLAGFLYFHH